MHSNMNFTIFFIAILFAAAASDSKHKTTTAEMTTRPSAGIETTNSYEFLKGESVCLKAQFSAHFERGEDVWNVTAAAKVDNAHSACGDLTVTYDGGNFTILFKQKDKEFYISAISVFIRPGIQASATNLTLAKAPNGSSYACMRGIRIPLSHNIAMSVKNFQVQPFYVKDGKFAGARRCSADVSPLIPIIVGVVLFGLILLVVAAYFVGRNRNRVGYEEI